MKTALPKILYVILYLLLVNLASYGQDTLKVSNKKLTQLPVNPDTNIVEITKSPRGAMLRSLVVPGWGQFYNGKWFKGILIGGTEIGLVINAVIQNHYAVQSETELEKEFYRENKSLSIWWLGATILYSITDAYVDAHLYNFDDSPNLSMKVKEEIEPLNNTKYSVISLNLRIPL
ncbi:hypothetical protein JXQ31_01660 [candidate division KSB1 bacterium]|nr:hypothetical protein [candidate division KSB1 bacterium]